MLQSLLNIPLTQTARMLLFNAPPPLGENVLLIRGFTAVETMSSPFSIDVDLIAEQDKAAVVAPELLLGRQVSIRMALGENFRGGPFRYFHGIVNRFSVGESDGQFVEYSASVVPWLWLLTQKSNCRVFEAASIPEIITEVFEELRKDFPFVKYKVLLNAKSARKEQDGYEPIDYCVQYRETDFNFISRLMEQEGLYYYFEHDEQGHTLVLTDHATALPPCPVHSDFEFAPHLDVPNNVASWRQDSAMRSGAYKSRDYHFQIPDKSLEASAETVHRAGDNHKLEMYVYPGDAAHLVNEPKKLGDQRFEGMHTQGRELARLRMQLQETTFGQAGGHSNCRTMAAGHTFRLSGHFDKSQNRDWQLLSVRHVANQTPDYWSGDEWMSTEPYQNSFACLAADKPYRPALATPRPVIEGVQSAVVVTPPDEEIRTDKFGRVRVRFHWDRREEDDDRATCWVRVAQAMAGQEWGVHFWPRRGQEVLVAFMNGDPDHPVVVGSLYNAQNMPPYAMSANQTRSGIKTRSTPDGNEQNFNEIRFEDKKGEEQVYIHAERNLDTVVEANETRNVGGSQTLTVKQYRQTYIEGDDQEFVYGEEGKKVEVEADIGMWARNEMHLTASNWLYLNSLYDAVMIHAPKSVSVQSDTEIVLEVGNSSLTINHAGITLKGPIVKIEGDMLTQVKGLMTQVEATGILATKAGAITQIR